MKKYFSLIAIAILALGIVSCNKKVDYNYSVELSCVYDDAQKAPAVTVTLSEEGTPFVLDFLPEDIAAKAKEADIFAAIVQKYGNNLKDLARDKSGTYYFRDNIWSPGKSYTFVAFAIDLNTLQQVSSMATTSITIPEKSNNQLTLTYDSYANDSVIYVKTTNNAPYYITIVEDSTYVKYIESGATDIEQFVALQMKADMDLSKATFPEREFAEIFDKYKYEGDMDFNFIDEFYTDFLKGKYHALAVGVEMVTSTADFRILPTTKGYECAFELQKDYIQPAEKRALLHGKNVPFKRMQRLNNVKIDVIKMHTPTLK